eukprot:CAMPEP_0196582474 /NCGR_PEP_ID=MMETSP1081-20130531/39027_1 /TAXON_ID=36882 /ORGANISM="Pyramimonas amylifera, Strain CCMP720" /LENGTH=184 /DNA_ID=CAMNT_0041903037 /DNA_START=159 /DNA_END=713 /DNA_ORIENTATION=+
MSSQRGNSAKKGHQAYQNKEAFTAERNVKFSETEIAARKKLQKVLDRGCCERCCEKLQWKFQYGKYKPLKTAAKCRQCRRTCIQLAYRTLCDTCARGNKQCPGCCEFESEEARNANILKKLMAKAGVDEMDSNNGESQVDSNNTNSRLAQTSDIQKQVDAHTGDLSQLLDDLAAEDDDDDSVNE